MTVRELLDCCTVRGVADVIAEMAEVPKENIADLEKRCQLIIEELKDSDTFIPLFE